MARKVFLSFLGTTDYVECNYYLEDDHSRSADNVKYAPEAIAQLNCSDFSSGDAMYFFLTEDAQKTNWEDDGHVDRTTQTLKKNKGLRARLNEKVPAPQKVAVEIPEGYDTEQIWTIFRKVYACLKEGDELVLDITHAFRSLPTLAMTMVTYARALKEIRLKGVYYGAFEALGNPREVSEMPLADRQAPVLDLTAFAELQEWSLAARDFLKFGNAAALSERARNGGAGLPSESGQILDRFSDYLSRLTQGVSTVRGPEIIEGRIFRELQDSIADLKKVNLPGPFQPLLGKVQEKVNRFKPGRDLENGLAAVRWCLDHQLIQQGITLLQEVTLTILMERLNEKGIALNIHAHEPREFVGKSLQVLAKGTLESQWRYPLNDPKNPERREMVRQLHAMPLVQQLAFPFRELSSLRNDINHGGFTDDNPPEKFRMELEEKFELIQGIIQAY